VLLIAIFNEPNFIPCSECSVNKNFNRFTRLILFVSLIISVIQRSTKALYGGIIAVAVIGILYFLGPNKMNVSEAFGNISNRPLPAVPIGYNYSGALGPGFSLPQYYETPSGSPLFYGKQESLLSSPNNPTSVSGQRGTYGNPGSPVARHRS